jgi:hypothetical protein
MTIDLDELEQLARAATPGPWDGTISTSRVRYLGPRQDTVEHGDYIASCTHAPDAEFIAAANPAVVLELVRRLRAAVAIVREVAQEPPVLQRTLPAPVFGDSPLSTIECAYCHKRDAINGYVIVHAESCPYRRAREAVKP